MDKTTLGVIIGNRGFFPDILARDGHEEILRVLAERGYKTVCLTPEETKFGAVESLQDARKCADLFKRHAGEIDGILVSLPNFGDEGNRYRHGIDAGHVWLSLRLEAGADHFSIS